MTGPAARETDARRAHFEEEAVPHLDAVYRFALRLSGDGDTARDLVQESYLRAWRAWDQYRAGTNCRSWLFTICRNLFLRQVERGQRHEEILREEVGKGSGPVAGPDVVNPVWVSALGRDPEGRFFDAIVDDEILKAIDALPEEYRTAVVLSDLEGLPYAEIAGLMDVPVGTVKSRLFRGRRRLQKELFDYAVEMGYIPEGEP